MSRITFIKPASSGPKLPSVGTKQQSQLGLRYYPHNLMIYLIMTLMSICLGQPQAEDPEAAASMIRDGEESLGISPPAPAASEWPQVPGAMLPATLT